MTVSAPRSVAEILVATAGEVETLAQMADDVQSAIVALSAGLGAGATTGRPEALVGCQAADMLSQRLSGLALYLNCLAIAAPQDALMDSAAAALALPLADQAATLGGWSRQHEADPSGELELFDV